ncbi:hypothetical protein TSOC_015337, partial [Tetrabaena socialis]
MGRGPRVERGGGGARWRPTRVQIRREAQGRPGLVPRSQQGGRAASRRGRRGPRQLEQQHARGR